MDETIAVLMWICIVVFLTMVALCVAGFVQEMMKPRKPGG